MTSWQLLLLLTRVAVATVAGWLLGLVISRPWQGVALVLGGMLVLELSRLERLLRWLRRNSESGAPDFTGLWGEVVAMMVRVFRRKQYHKQRLLRLLREFRESTAAMPDGVVLLNPEAEILWFNRTAGMLLGLHGRSDMGLRIENLVRQPEFVQYLRSGDYSVPVVVRTTSSTELFLALQLVPYGAGQLLLLVRDVTHQARLEAMRKDFVANASHELRSPLTVISGYLETLAADSGLEPSLAAPLAEMQRQAQRMNAIVRDLLELSKLEASDREVVGDFIDVRALLAQLKKDVMARAVHPSQVTTSCEADEQLLGDEVLIHSAFSNLVDNAVKYTSLEGSISVRWWVDGAGGHFEVADTGIGISPEHIPRLTERFYRVDAGRSRATGGSGLGLAIVKHVLQRHGGSLQIVSAEGQGSRFICHFPPHRLRSSAQRIAAAAL